MADSITSHEPRSSPAIILLLQAVAPVGAPPDRRGGGGCLERFEIRDGHPPLGPLFDGMEHAGPHVAVGRHVVDAETLGRLSKAQRLGVACHGVSSALLGEEVLGELAAQAGEAGRGVVEAVDGPVVAGQPHGAVVGGTHPVQAVGLRLALGPGPRCWRSSWWTSSVTPVLGH